MAEPARTQMTTKYGACALYNVQLRLQTHRTRNTHCFSTATMVTRTRPNVTTYM